MSRVLRNMRGVAQDYNRFINCIGSSIDLLEPPYLAVGKDKRSLETDEPIKFIAEEVALRHARPSELDRVEISIGFLLKYNSSNFDCYYEDMISSSFNVMFRAIDKESKGNNYFGFHFDLDGASKSTSTDNEQEQLHPKYHTQFLQNPNDVDDFHYGSSLQLDIPRFTHFPMDFILGTSFIIANFAPQLFEELRSNEEYISLQRKYQNLLWKPYLNVLKNLLLNNDSNDFKTANQLHPYWI